MNLKDRFWSTILDKRFLALIFVVNIIGTLFGYYYYRWQLAESALIFWIFIPDCPNATLLLLISILVTFTDLGSKLNSEVLNFITSAYLIKYGLWTVFTILFYSNYFLSPPIFYYYLFLLVAHFGMALESIVILPFSKIDIRKLLIFLIWFLLNDLMDYAFGTHPYVPENSAKMRILMIFTVLMSFVSIGIVYIYPKIGNHYASIANN